MKTNRLGAQKAPWNATKYRKWDCVQNQARLSSSHTPFSAAGLIALHPQATSPEAESWLPCGGMLAVSMKAALRAVCLGAFSPEPQTRCACKQQTTVQHGKLWLRAWCTRGAQLCSAAAQAAKRNDSSHRWTLAIPSAVLNIPLRLTNFL